MGCFPACFRHSKHKKTMKNVQNQCSSPKDELHESAKLLPATMESLKEEEIINPIKLVQESDTNELTSTNNEDKLEETEKERIEHKDDKLEETEKERIEHKDAESESKDVAFVQEEESYDSLFSLSIDSRRQVFAVEMEDKEVNSPLLRSCHVSKYHEDKENVGLNEDRPMIKQSKGELSDDCTMKKRESETEIAADTSLSSWLVVSEKLNKKRSVDSSPQSEKNYGGREVLGELNGVLSGGSTPCCSGDDQLGIGTVGGYWQRRGRAEEVVVEMGTGASCKGVLTVSTKV